MGQKDFNGELWTEISVFSGLEGANCLSILDRLNLYLLLQTKRQIEIDPTIQKIEYSKNERFLFNPFSGFFPPIYKSKSILITRTLFN
jgi:hypothetical protein